MARKLMMKHFLFTLLICFLSSSISYAQNLDHPTTGIVFAITHNGETRYEELEYTCSRYGKSGDFLPEGQIFCSFMGNYIALAPKQYSRNLDEYKKMSKTQVDEENKKFMTEFQEQLDNFAKKSKDEIIKSGISEFDYNEFVEMYTVLKNSENPSLDIALLSDKKEQNTCRASVDHFEMVFTKNGDVYEWTNTSDLFYSGIKKANYYVFEKDPKTNALWNFTINSTYMGNPKDGKELPPPIHNKYLWQRPSRLPLNCSAIKMGLF